MDIIPQQTIENKIIEIRNQKIMIDADIASLYGVETKVFNQAVKRNSERFPEDFMFQLTEEEYEILKSQNVTSSWGGRRTLPYAFTEQGIYMVATVLKSSQAIKTNIAIMRTFTSIRQHASNYISLFQKIENLENNHDRKFDLVAVELQKIYEILDDLASSPINDDKKMGFIKNDK